MYTIHLYTSGFNNITKYNAIGSLNQIKEGAKVKRKQTPNAQHIHIYKGLNVVATL